MRYKYYVLYAWMPAWNISEMPYTGKRKRSVGYTTGRNTRRRRATRARSMNIRSGGFLGMENKFYDQFKVVTNAGTTIGTPIILSPQNTAAYTLNTVPQGDGESNRDGRAINMLSLHFRANVRLPAQQNLSTGPDSASGCIYIVLDKQCNGAVPTAADIFSVAGGTTTYDVDLFNNLQYTKRFKILKKMKFRLGYKAAGFDGTSFDLMGEEINFKKTINLRGMRCTFSGTSEDVANIVDNSITVFFVSNAVSKPVISWRSRLRYKG